MSQNAVSEKTNGKTISKKIEIRGIEFAVALPEKTAAGNSLNIVLIVKNDRKEEIAYCESTPRLLHLTMQDAKGAAVPLTRFGDFALGKRKGPIDDGRKASVFVPPGKAVTESFNLGRVFDLSMAGSYKFSLKRDVRPHVKSNSEVPMEIKDIAFEITNPQR